MEEMRRRLNAAEREAEEMSARLSSEELSYEAKLTEVYNAHRERVEKLSWDISSRDEELQQVGRGVEEGEAQGDLLLTTPASDISGARGDGAMEDAVGRGAIGEEFDRREVLCQSSSRLALLPSTVISDSAMSASATHAALRI